MYLNVRAPFCEAPSCPSAFKTHLHFSPTRENKSLHLLALCVWINRVRYIAPDPRDDLPREEE